MKIRARNLRLAMLVAATLATTARAGQSGDRDFERGHDHAPPASTPTLVVRWNETLLECIRVQRLGPPMTARAIAMTYTAGFDAWACYDAVAVPTGSLPLTRTNLPRQRRVGRQRHHGSRENGPCGLGYRAAPEGYACEASLGSTVLVHLGS